MSKKIFKPGRLSCSDQRLIITPTFLSFIEWTIVQLTPQYNIMDQFNEDNDVYYTNPIHISVFKCGKNQPKPFMVTVSAPRDPVNGTYKNGKMCKL